ncbi:MAG: dUTP diphosphatase [Acidobacteriota bacterium]
MEHLTVRISPEAPHGAGLPLPRYATEGSAGMDVLAAVTEPVEIPPGTTALIPAGFSIELPPGFEAQIRPRSGLALKSNIGILNAPGTIDSDYRGEVKIILTNFGRSAFTVNRGDRIAQMVVARHARVEWVVSGKLDDTARGAGGFGHTGV